MRRHRVLRHVKQSREFTCWNAVGLAAHKQPKGLEPGVLGKRGKRGDGSYIIHVSRITDIISKCQMLFPGLLRLWRNAGWVQVLERMGIPAQHHAQLSIAIVAASAPAATSAAARKCFRAFVRIGRGRLRLRCGPVGAPAVGLIL